MTGDCGCCGLRVSGHWSQRGEMRVLGSLVFENRRNGEIERFSKDKKKKFSDRAKKLQLKQM